MGGSEHPFLVRLRGHIGNLQRYGMRTHPVGEGSAIRPQYTEEGQRTSAKAALDVVFHSLHKPRVVDSVLIDVINVVLIP